MILACKRLLIAGVVADNDVGRRVAVQAQRDGAHIVLVAPPGRLETTERLAGDLSGEVETIAIDPTERIDYARAVKRLGYRWGKLDGIVNVPTPPPRDSRPVPGLSLRRLAIELRPLLNPPANSASLVEVDWTARRRLSRGPDIRQLAREMARFRIRANLVTAGRLCDDTTIARAACFLLSEWADGITGEVLHVTGEVPPRVLTPAAVPAFTPPPAHVAA